MTHTKTEDAGLHSCKKQRKICYNSLQKELTTTALLQHDRSHVQFTHACCVSCRICQINIINKVKDISVTSLIRVFSLYAVSLFLVTLWGGGLGTAKKNLLGACFNCFSVTWYFHRSKLCIVARWSNLFSPLRNPFVNVFVSEGTTTRVLFSSIRWLCTCLTRKWRHEWNK